VPSTIAEPRDLLVTALTEMLYVEQKLADEVLPELRDQIKTPEFKEGVKHHLEETKRHAENLERAFQILGETPKADKSHSLDGLVAQREKVIKRIESDDLRELFNASAAAKTEHLEIAAYESMINTAETLGQSELVDLLEENLADEKDTLKEVEKVAKKLSKEKTTA
jgi:ferritin-like metal-binding protein YciE